MMTIISSFLTDRDDKKSIGIVGYVRIVVYRMVALFSLCRDDGRWDNRYCSEFDIYDEKYYSIIIYWNNRISFA